MASAKGNCDDPLDRFRYPRSTRPNGGRHRYGGLRIRGCAGAGTSRRRRDPRRARSAQGAEAVERIRNTAPAGTIRFERLDLADLPSIADFAGRLAEASDAVHLLINNADVMIPPQRRQTTDGFELQLGTNHLGHFALTAHLLPLVRRAEHARVISLSSVAAPRGAIDFDDLNAEAGYKPMPVYAQSKLACLMFAFELQRRSDAAGWGLSSIAAHPGISRTDLIHNGAGRASLHEFLRSYLPFLFQPAERGALPTLYAATSPEARPGAYYGPDGIGEARGYPAPAKVPPQALDEAVAARLWDVSEALTGVRFPDEVADRLASQRSPA